MKTKHIITALALPLAFAACSDEQFEGLESNIANNENRPYVGQVTFENGDIESRFAMNAATGAITWQDGDAFGMMMMDEPNASGAIAIGTRKYNLVNQAKSNYPFTNNGGAWTSEAELLEGNYFYYFPYTNNQKDLTKSNVTRNNGLTWILPSDQNAFTTDAPTTLNTYNAVKENQLYVGYQALNADNVETNLENMMVPAFPTIYFKLVNTDASPVTINRVVLEERTAVNGTAINPDAFGMKSVLNVSTGVSGAITYTSYNKDTDPELESHTVAAGANIATAFEAFKTAVSADKNNYSLSPFANLGTTSYFTQSEKVATIALNLPETTLAQGEAARAVMIVPNGGMDNAKLQARIYTNKGIVLVPLTVGMYKVSTEITDPVTKGLIKYEAATVGTDPASVATQEAKVELSSLKTDGSAYVPQETGSFEKLVPNQGATVTISFNANAISVPGKMDIYKTADLDAFLNYCKAANVTVDTQLEATLKGTDIALSKNAYDILNGNDKIKLTVLADVNENTLTISKDITGTDALNKLTWDATDPVVNAVIEEGATQVVSANFANKIFNKGTLKIENYTDATPAVAVETTTGVIYNVGSLTVTTPLATASIINGTLATLPANRTWDNVVVSSTAAINANVNGPIKNFASVTTTASTVSIIENSKVSKPEEDDKVGTVTVNGDLTSTFYNAGDLTINAVVNATVLTNTGNVNVNAGKEFYIAGTSSNGADATIVNNGTIEIISAFTNNGTFTNNYGLVCQSSGTFTNANEMIVNTSSVYTYISDNANGEITIYDRKEELRIADGALLKQGIISYTAIDSDYTSNKFTSAKGDKFNKLIVEKAGADLSGINYTDAVLLPTDYATVTSLALNVNSDCAYTFDSSAAFDNLEVGIKDNTVNCIIQAYATNLQIKKSLTVNTKTTFHVTTGNTVTFTNTTGLNNLGTILVGGTFNIPSINKPANTTNYKEAGGSIIWQDPSL